jgi:hypothetical protein
LNKPANPILGQNDTELIAHFVVLVDNFDIRLLEM